VDACLIFNYTVNLKSRDDIGTTLCNECGEFVGYYTVIYDPGLRHPYSFDCMTMRLDFFCFLCVNHPDILQSVFYTTLVDALECRNLRFVTRDDDLATELKRNIVLPAKVQQHPVTLHTVDRFGTAWFIIYS
jgi:hypothetical protein